MGRNRHKDDFEDDGRVIADMSGVERPSLFFGRAPRDAGAGRGSAPGSHSTRGQNPAGAQPFSSTQNLAGAQDPYAGQGPYTVQDVYAARDVYAAQNPCAAQNPKADEDEQFTTEERRWMLLGGLKAGLTISLIYVVILGAIILALILIWNLLSS